MTAPQAPVEARIERTTHEITALRGRMNGWLGAWGKRAEVRAYRSQLRALEQVLEQGTTRIVNEIPSVVAAATSEDRVGALYLKCTRADMATVWLERVWSFYAQRFEQRNDPRLAAVLRAADEVVWSCWAPFIAQFEGPVRPPPLPYFEAQFSPAATPSELIPEELRPPGDQLWKCVNGLPIPLLRLTPLCVHEPWWLIFVAHEVGHHVQYAAGLVESFRDAVEQAVDDSGVETSSERWRAWSTEIFADLYSVACVGPWAMWAIAEFERGTDDFMTAPRSSYPSPAVRLGLLALAVRRLTNIDDASPYLRGIDLDRLAGSSKTVKRELEVAEAIIDQALAQLPPIDTDWANHSLRLSEWRAPLVAGDDVASSSDLWSARIAVAAGCAAWDDLGWAGGQRDSLRARLIPLVQKCSPEGDRAAADTDIRTDAFADALWDAATRESLS